MKYVLTILAVIVLRCTAEGQTVDTFKVHFYLNDARVTRQSEEYIDQLFYRNRIMHGQKLIILGYADHLGSEQDNLTLSEKRATHVRDYLVASGFREGDIRICIGKGEIGSATANEEGNPADRIVQIIIDRAPRSNATNPAMRPPLFDIATLRENDVIPLDDVLFESGREYCTEASYPTLSKLRSFLKKNPSVRIQIEGHICCNWGPFGKSGIDSGLNSLSGRRANHVYEFLVNNGVAPDRMKYVGLGLSDPFVHPEKTPEDEAKNRRVGIRIISR